MNRETTYKGILGDWEQLNKMLSENSAELPHLEMSRLKLEELLRQGLEVAARQSALRAEKQEASRQIRGLIADGQRLVSVLRLAVKEHYGPRAEKLVAFGVQPFRGRKPKDKQPTPPPAEPSPAEPAS